VNLSGVLIVEYLSILGSRGPLSKFLQSHIANLQQLSSV
jgi:hypothetical protein